MSSLRGNRLPADPTPCAACPWRTANHGKRTPDGWYTKANLRRLWAGLRTGEAPGMTCHPTDPDNPAPTGRPNAVAPAGADFKECAGAHILMQREMTALQDLADKHNDGAAAWREYRGTCQRPGLTVDGFMSYATLGLPPMLGGVGAAPLAMDLDQEVSRP